MTVKPHFLSILLNTIKLIGAVVFFFAIAVVVSPDKYATALRGTKFVILLTVVVYAYLFYFWSGVHFVFGKDKIEFFSKIGRKNHVVIPYKDINEMMIMRTSFLKKMNVFKIKLDVDGMTHRTGSDLSVVENYLVFKKAQCIALADLYKKFKEEL